MNIKIKEGRDYNQIKIVCNFVSRKIKKTEIIMVLQDECYS